MMTTQLRDPKVCNPDSGYDVFYPKQITEKKAKSRYFFAWVSFFVYLIKN